MIHPRPATHLHARKIRHAVASLLLLCLSVSFTACSGTSTPLQSHQSDTVSSVSAAQAPSDEMPEEDVSVSNSGSSSENENEQILSAITDSQIVYLGETHSDPADHTAQLEIIQALNDRNDIVIGLEMFQRPFQPAVDAYLAGEITEAELLEDTEYETRWGYDWAFYAPILRYAKENQIPVLALNTPAEVTRKVATDGLSSLSGEELKHIPPVADIDLTDKDYRATLESIFSAHGGAGHSASFDNFFAAQVLWDETMAEAVADQHQRDPQRQVIVLAGEGHVAYGYGIPNRVARRLPDVEQDSVLLLPPDAPTDEAAADWIWVTSEPSP